MISVKNLSFSYGDKIVFDNFCAGFSSGISCITGPSGRGKTTLLRIIGGLDTMALPGNLSGGQQRRIAIARCLAYEPDLILLDEPFKGLDPALAEKVAKVIKETGVPTIAVLHSKEEIDYLDGEVFSV